MSGKKRVTRSTWRDPDDAPELTEEFFRRADQFEGARLVRRGRPKARVTKVALTLRLSPEVIEHFKAGGPGWQTRIDQTLKRVVTRARGSARE